MLGPSGFRELVSGRQKGAAASALRMVLRGCEVPYALAVGWRNRRYDLGRAAVTRVNVPVVSVGNLTLGGTGKTPLVKWITQWAIAQGHCPAIVSRGYGAAVGELNDEGRELAQALPGVPHVQNPDRVAAAQCAIDEFAARFIVLDDGFQHRRLERDLDIVLIDALEPFGFDHVFPRGTLREPVPGLTRANVVCLSRADLAPPEQRRAIRERVAQLAPQAEWCEVVYAPNGLMNSASQTQSLETLRGRRVAAFCGIGNPAGFRHTLDAIGCVIVAWREFPDHHAFEPGDLDQLAASAGEAEVIVCTHKDIVKVGREQLGDRPLWAVMVELQFVAGQDEMERAPSQVIK